MNMKLMRDIEKDVLVDKSNIKKAIGCNDSYAYLVLERLEEKGIIKKIIKGKYTTKDNIYLITSNIYIPSYISFWSAAYQKGYTEQILNTIQVATLSRKRNIKFENYSIQFIKLPNKMFFGFEKKRIENNNYFLVDDEKMLIDILYKEEAVGNFGEIIKIIKHSKIDKEKIKNYLERIGNTSLTKRTGFLLEKYLKIDIGKKITDKNYILLSKQTKGKKISAKWRIKHDLD